VAVGLSTTNLANNWLNMLRGSAFNAPTSLYVKLHVGDPGSAGTASPSAVATRAQLTLAQASGGAVALTGTQPSWLMTASENISHISVWDNASSGSFLWSAQLAVTKTVASGDTLTLTTCGLSLSPLAA